MMAGSYNRNTVDQIKLCSYNVKDYDEVKYDAIKSLFQKCTILLVQETWLSENEFIRRFKNDFPNSECISSNKMDLKDIGPGRRYGGVGICYHSNIRCNVEHIKTNSKSICAISIAISNINLLLINVYMPSSDNRDKLDEYSEILNEVSSICLNSTTQYIIIGGDWNANSNRNDGRSKLFKEFIAQENLYNVLDSDVANVRYTYYRENGPDVDPTTSTIDHFIILPNL